MKKILITAKAMNSGGVEVSLLDLINELNKSNELNITLLLQNKVGKYLEDIPSNINVKELIFKKEVYSNLLLSRKEAENFLPRNKLMSFYVYKIIKKIYDKFGINFEDDILLNSAEAQKEQYDLVIDFHGYAYFMSKYVSKKVKATKKVMFIHDERMDWLNKVKNYMNDYDKFYCVSIAVKNIFQQMFSQYADRADIFYNIINKEKIVKLAEEKIDVEVKDCCKILTIGRLEYQKGYDLLIKIASQLKKQNEDFVWYIIGTGSLKSELEGLIRKENLQSNVIMLGFQKNPYPYLKWCDIYVQPSRHEGYGIAIAEARCFGKPVVATDLNCIREQFENVENGMLCGFDENEFTRIIQDLIHNTSKREYIEENMIFSGNKSIDKLLNLL